MTGFNVTYNNLSGVVPQSLQRFPSSSFHPGNDLLVLPNEAPSPKGGNNLNFRDHGSRTKSANRAALIAGLVGGVSVIAILTLVIYVRVHQERSKATSTETGGKKVLSSTEIESGNQPATVSSVVPSPKDRDHPESTKLDVVSSPMSMTPSVNTSPAKLRHQSENPSALKVCSPDKLAGDLHLFDNSLKFTPEELSSALQKPSGFYWGPKEHEKLIISKYINAPSLALYLHGTDQGALPPLSLADRQKVALDVACCLTYLHTESAIPHGNLKSTNILIEVPNINVLLTDYSLHRLLTSAGTAEQVLNAGALGYLPPEFTSTSKPCPSLKSDVYAFGVILLELLTGRSSADIVPGNPEVVDLSEWVSLMAAENRAVECFDLQILGTESRESLPKGLDSMLQIALKCILPAAERPDMRMIFEELSAIQL
ncbi:UNVERIFIED_CONTAM: putative inactive receptor kinase [Sesamum radiatum]|uniref:Inactive receptor kinase n=1 Tax=Sesamum radiatum TaxID=300843 RepID=A0AAW2URE6_SESRA